MGQDPEVSWIPAHLRCTVHTPGNVPPSYLPLLRICSEAHSSCLHRIKPCGDCGLSIPKALRPSFPTLYSDGLLPSKSRIQKRYPIPFQLESYPCLVSCLYVCWTMCGVMSSVITVTSRSDKFLLSVEDKFSELENLTYRAKFFKV